MRVPLLAISITAVALAAGGCASKPPLPDSIPAVPAKPEQAKLPPATASAQSEARPRPPASPSQTPEERRAILEKQLDDSLSSFDAQLREEQQKTAQERDARKATVTTVAVEDAADTSSGDGAGTGGPRADGHGDARTMRPGDLKSDQSAVGTPASANGNGAVANEIPDGDDDDVVARRLRKAAEQETDPELQEKLWKEYVEYRKNAQRNR